MRIRITTAGAIDPNVPGAFSDDGSADAHPVDSGKKM